MPMTEHLPSTKKPVLEPPPDVNPRTEPVLDFPDMPPAEMSSGDYATLGFLGGLEVHQQIATRRKLFCRCPSGVRAASHDAEVLRHMRPTLSELGEYDGTALMEFKTKKEIVYLLDRNTVCTYEIDDTPPFPIDEDAVRVAVEMARLLNLNLVSELHVMRKQYLDGSIPTGFQRTAMVALGGSIPFRVPDLGVDRELSIRQLSLEEDSCREVSDIGHRIVFRTDRLGMPLTETVTEPELLTPLELRAAARLLADTARATGKVRRGPGAARQDVNVSIAGGRRIEIKGVANHNGLPVLVHIEAFRQLNLLRIRELLKQRGVEAVFEKPGDGDLLNVCPLVTDATGIFRNTTSAPIREALERGETVVGVRLPGFRGVLCHPTQPGLTFASELEGRVRVIACPVHRPFLAWSDGSREQSGREWTELRSELAVEDDDALVVTWAPGDDWRTAAEEILTRAREALVGIPAETRQALGDGRTTFERVLPGADRMYPDTDTPPLPISPGLVLEIEGTLPETPWHRAERYEKMGFDPLFAARAATAPWHELFDELAGHCPEHARRLGHALAKRIPFHLRRGTIAGVNDARLLEPLARAVGAGRIRPEALERAIDAILTEPDKPVEGLLAPFSVSGDDESELRALISELAAKSATLRTSDPGARLRWGMGFVMRKMLGKTAPADVASRVGEALGLDRVEVRS